MAYRCDIDGQQVLTIFGKQPDCINSASAQWLHPCERKQFEQFPLASRRLTWLQGRLAMKQLVLEADPRCGLPQELEIVSKDEQQELGCAPRVHAAGRLLKWRLSLSHTTHHFAACMALEESIAPGIDIVEHSELVPSQLRFWLREDEKQRLAPLKNDDELARLSLARLWSAKEAAFKTLPMATAFQPQSIEVTAWDQQCNTATWRTADNLFTGVLRWDVLPELTLASAIRRL